MKIIKEILARIFALWAVILFIITMLIVFIPMVIIGLWPEPKRTRLFHLLSQVWMAIFLTLTGVWIVRKGKEHFSQNPADKKRECYIVICNHNTLMDVPVTTPWIPGANKSIAKIEMSRIPLFGIIYKRGAVLVDRRNEESRKASYGKMKDVLKMGLHMCVYPEGTRNKTKEPLQPFHSGAFRLAVDSGRAIIPAVLFNTNKVLPNNKTFYYWPGKIEMHFLEPVPVGSMTADELKEKLFFLMKEYYVQHRH
jgi:1-acyl-sn-glycerol-3-phosphate acyltransferase